MKRLQLLALSLFISLSSFAEVSKNEREALVDLYKSTQGEYWTNSWDLEEAVEHWYGVTVEDDKVVALQLGMNNLKGDLPESIGQLKNLKILELFFNKISGNLPESIGQLTQLKKLILNGNFIEGALPQSLYTLSNLEELMITSNRLTGTLTSDVKQLTALKKLHLFDNAIGGVLPEELTQLRELKELILGNNKLEGAIPFGLASNLDQLQLDGNLKNAFEGVASNE